VWSGDRCWLLGLRFGDPSDNRSPPTHNRHFDLINNVNYFNDKHVYKYNYNASSDRTHHIDRDFSAGSTD
jgi:hypothetical protein